MKLEDQKEYIKRYESRLNEFGYSPKTLGWGKSGRQEVRFYNLTEEIIKCSNSSVLDVGCGFADLYKYLTSSGWSGRYVGIDIVPGLLEIAKQQYEGVDVQVGDIADETFRNTLGRFDFVVASGVFNAQLSQQKNVEHVEISLNAMFNICNMGVFVDFMCSHVDFQAQGAWHTDPSWIIQVAHKITPRFRLDHSYMPFEFSLALYCNSSKSVRNVFQDYENKIAKSGCCNFSVQE